jgi:hypothetical protein
MPDQTIPLPASEYEKMLADMAKAKSAIEAHELDTAFATGGVQAAKQIMESRISKAEQAAASEAVKSSVRSALSEHQLVPHGAEQLTKILSSQLTAVKTPGGLSVVGQNGQDARAYVASVINQPGYAHFRATTPAPSSPTPTPGNPPTTIAEPKNLGEKMIAQFQARQVAPATDPRTNMGAAFGLKPLPR